MPFLRGQYWVVLSVPIVIEGAKRAAFSNEAGIGTAPMMHGAAKTDEPIRGGLVAMLGPFVDTVGGMYHDGFVHFALEFGRIRASTVYLSRPKLLTWVFQG